MNVFARYSPFIQDFIYRSGWQTLRGVQNAAGEAIFNTDDNVLLTASTASGKTEAAFFPMLTLLDENPSSTVGILYIAPLKALINDQFGRLQELCEEAGIEVYRWHGDVAQSRKRKLLRKPSGILQITPESLVKIYKALGVVEKGHLVECDRGALVAGYTGQTAIKTGEVIASCP